MGAFENWESQLQARAGEMLARRIAPLKAEIERLQGAISEIGSRLAEQDRIVTDSDSSTLIEEVKRWIDDRAAKAEEDFKSRIEEAAANARREADLQIEELRGQLEASRALTMAVSSSQSAFRSFEMFKAAIEDIDSQRTQSDTLAALVRHAAEFAPRVVFFVIKSGEAVGWKARGFENGLSDETVKLLTVPAQKPALLRDALTSLRVATSNTMKDGGKDGSDALGIYGAPAPARAIAIPLIVLNKAVAVLYADSGTQPEDSLNTAAAESLTRIAGKTIEFVLSRRSAETARSGAHTAGTAEASPATPLRTDGKAMGAAIQQTPGQSTIQPTVQMDSASVESGFKPGAAPETLREITEEAPEIEKTGETTGASSISPASLDRVTIERRRTQELPIGFDKPSQVDARPDADADADADDGSGADDGLREAEAQTPEPAHIETEPSPAPEPYLGAEAPVGVSGRLRFVEPQPSQPLTPPAPVLTPVEAEEQPVFGAPAAASSMPLPDLAAPQVEEPPASSDIPAFSPPPAPPVFIPSAKPPKSAQSIASVSGGSETEQRAHNDARRFARLLVSEIKLYNAAKVNDGRRNYDLYERLKDEIDRNRKVYDKRVSPTVAARFDYFYEELVQTLAEGDPAKLGKDCPGPVALA
jgi:hypothetical protein